MKIGMNLLLWTGNVTEEHFPLIDQLAGMGYEGVEIPIFSFDRAAYKAVRSHLDGLGIGCTAVTVVPPEGNPISDDPKVRAAGVDYLKRAIEMAETVGADVLCGPFCSPVGLLVGRARTEDEWRWAVEGMKQAAEAASEADVMLAVEYLNRFETYFLNTAADTRKLVREVDHPNFQMMLDTFHSNIEEKDVYSAYADSWENLVHVHISENDRGVPGKGHVPWSDVFRALNEVNYDRWLVIESFGTSIPEIAKAASVWRELSPSNDAVATEGIQFIRKGWAAARV